MWVTDRGIRFRATGINLRLTVFESVLRVFVNGAAVTTNPREIELTNDQEIVVTYGTESELPKPMPSTLKNPACAGKGFFDPSGKGPS